MKTIHLIRHGDSHFAGYGLSDFDRTLSATGMMDAKRMGRNLRSRNPQIDGFVSSPSVRAKNTAEIFMREYQFPEENLRLFPDLYEAVMSVFFQVVEDLPNELSSVALVAHNPGISGFINSFGVFPSVNMPSGGVFSLDVHTDCWDELRFSKCQFLFFDYPGKNA